MSDSTNRDPMVIFTRTFDMLSWLLPHTKNFPAEQRFILTKRLMDAALDFQEVIFEANARSGKVRIERLELADAHLSKLRLYLRLAYQWHWLSSGQYQHVSQMVLEIGKLLGGWLRQSRATPGDHR